MLEFLQKARYWKYIEIVYEVCDEVAKGDNLEVVMSDMEKQLAYHTRNRLDKLAFRRYHKMSNAYNSSNTHKEVADILTNVYSKTDKELIEFAKFIKDIKY